MGEGGTMKKLICILTALLLPVVAIPAQEDAVVVLEFASDLSQIQVLDRNDFEVEIFFGIGLSPGDRIITGDSAAELRMEPNGSIIRLAPGTTLSIDTLQGHQEQRENAATLRSGRARLVAARSATRDNRYVLRTPALVAGVRGTDFALAVIPASEGADSTEEAFVFDGEVFVTALASGEEVFLTAGQGIAAGDEPFLPQEWGAERIEDFQRDIQFEQLDPEAVPGLEPDEPPAPAVVEAPPPEPPPAPPPAEPAPGAGDRFFGTLAEITGLHVGSVTINRQTWGQVVFLPQITVGDLALAFYLPFTYQTNLFDPEDWYQPEGNNEWSFGTDQDWSGDPQGAMADVATDLALKIRYIQYRDQGAPFFFKMGNLSTFTIGQGLLMRNYANDTEFPAVRRLGFNIGVDRTAWGLEAFVNDLIAPNIFGGRLYFRPAAPVIPAAVGFSAVTDIHPAGAINRDSAEGDELFGATREADPVFISVATDLDVPVLRGDALSLTGFIEAGALVPYVRTSTEYEDRPVSSGTKTNAMVDFQSGNLRNYGWTTGVRGDLLFFDFRLAYQYWDGTFRPGFYGPNYDRLRGTYAAETIAYLSNTEAREYKGSNMGVQGELGATLFDALRLGAGYLWPWEVTPSGSWVPSPEDELRLFFALREGVIPLGIGAGLEYRRRYFAPSLGRWSGYSRGDLFDVHTTLDGYLSYPLTDFISIVGRVSTAALRDAEGDLVYGSDGRPRMAPTITIQTEIGLK
ncbi:MAG: hypothetical protein EA427_12545 [Spirochaetaceae bacterium]|nr:MAG: hypothetical protein EA427_12545 [Spirochaetaceae bacterium]